MFVLKYNRRLNKNQSIRHIPRKKISVTPIRFYSPPENTSTQDFVRVGQLAPNFESVAVVNNEVKKIKLSDYKGKWIVLFFYPLDFTFVCPTEITAFSDRSHEFREIGAELIGASVDSHFSHLAWVNTPRTEGGLGKIEIPLIGDINKELAKKYGALYGETGFTLRALYIIDPHGKIRHITMNDPPVGRSVDEVLRTLKAFQFTDKHGEVCPVDWKPGSDTIIPDPKKKKKYFEKKGKD